MSILQLPQRGRCLCGALQYEATAQPVRLTLCYCTFCQRATGSTHMVEPIFAKSDFRVIAGDPKIYSLTSAGSGKRVDVHFCPECGTKLALGFERFPEVVGVYAGTFDDPSWFSRDPTITACLFLDEAPAGAIVPPGVPAYRRHRTNPDGSPNRPVTYAAPLIVSKEP